MHAKNYGTFGARKLHIVLNREPALHQRGHFARCTIERLMSDPRIFPESYGRRLRTRPGQRRRNSARLISWIDTSQRSPQSACGSPTLSTCTRWT